MLHLAQQKIFSLSLRRGGRELGYLGWFTFLTLHEYANQCSSRREKLDCILTEVSGRGAIHFKDPPGGAIDQHRSVGKRYYAMLLKQIGNNEVVLLLHVADDYRLARLE